MSIAHLSFLSPNQLIYRPVGRGRWIDYSQDDFNASQATPEWHSWLHGIRKDPPTEDPIVQASRPPWLAVRPTRSRRCMLLTHWCRSTTRT